MRANLLGWNLPGPQIMNAVAQVNASDEKIIYQYFLDASDQYRKTRIADVKGSMILARTGLTKREPNTTSLTHIRFKRDVVALLARHVYNC